jgi:glycosyltransferase involved in cell wall biosynthesis
LLQVWRKHPEVTANHTLLIAGKPLDDVYEQQLAEQIAETKGAVFHPGFVKEHLIPVYFSAADVVVLPFENILTSGSLVLAMSYGKPIIAPRLGNIPETIGAADWLLYDVDEAQGLGKAIEKSTRSDLDQLRKLTGEMSAQLGWDKIAHQNSSTLL